MALKVETQNIKTFVWLMQIGYKSIQRDQQDHTSQDHFCSVIDEFPVWNSEPDQPTMMSWAAAPEREEVSELSTEVGYIDDRSSSYYRRMEGTGAVWVVL